MTCPACGGTQLRLVEPGVLECQSQALYNVIPAGAQGNVVDVPLYRPCSRRFRVPSAPGIGQCACGLFAVGACTECGSPLCHRHVDEYGGRIMCAEHAGGHRAIDAAAEKNRVTAARAATMQQVTAWEQAAASALLNLADATERRVRMMAADLPQLYTPELEALRLPRRWSEMTPDDVESLVQWFLRRVTAAPEQIEVREASLFSSYGKAKKRLGWWLTLGSTADRAMPHGESEPGSLAILQDGRIWYQRSFTPQSGERLSIRGLNEMMRHAGLQQLLAEPRPHHWDDPYTDRSMGRYGQSVYTI